MKVYQFILIICLISIHFKLFQGKEKEKPKEEFSSKTNKKPGKKFRVFLLSKLKVRSFWHYVNFKNDDKTYNMVVEIPKKTRAKYEMSKEENKNPIKQDLIKTTKELRFYKIDPIFNYGFFPQTWENSVKKYFGKYKGDDDPYDVVEIGSSTYRVGQVVRVRVLGSFCLIDNNEVDWKILVINDDEYEDYKKNKKYYKKKFKDIMYWFKTYKTFEGKDINKILFNDKIFSVIKTKRLIERGYLDYLDLINKKIKGVDYSKYHF